MAIKIYMAFVMLKVEGEQLIEVVDMVSGLDNVLGVYAITGDYDLMVVLSSEDYEEIGKTIVHKIAKIPYIKESRTYMAFRSFKG